MEFARRRKGMPMNFRRFAKPLAAAILTLGLLATGATPTGASAAKVPQVPDRATIQDTGWGVV